MAAVLGKFCFDVGREGGLVERSDDVNEDNKAAVDKMIALMEQSVKQGDPRDQTNLWDWYAGHALGGIMGAPHQSEPELIAEYVRDVVSAIMKVRPKA